jgi:hypothetical protein
MVAVVVTDHSTKLQSHVRRKEPAATGTNHAVREPKLQRTVAPWREDGMRSVKSTLVWLIGFPLPIILLIALFLHPG